MRDFIEFYLRKTHISYVVDDDNTDYKNMDSLHQKRDRQMIFLVFILYSLLEYVWDLAKGGSGAEKKSSKVKSKISSGV